MRQHRHTSPSQPRIKARLLRLSITVLALVAVMFVIQVTSVSAQEDVTVIAEDLSRLSWGAVIAGAILCFMIQIVLNLFGIGVGLTQIHPYHTDEAGNPRTVGFGTVVWLGFTVILSLFIGGFVAARFAGIPNAGDGLLHGLLVWGLVSILTMFLLSTTIGRVISGLASLFGTGIDLLGTITGTVARTAGQAAGTVARGAAHAASGAAHAAGDVAREVRDRAEDVAADVEYRTRDQREDLRHRAEDAVDDVRHRVEQSPEVQNAMQQRNLSRETILNEARALLREAGVSPDELEQDAREAVQDVQDSARRAAQQAPRDPQGAVETVIASLGRAIDTLEGDVREFQQVDRDALVHALASRTDMTEEAARRTVNEWESRYNQARGEAARVRADVERRIDQARRDVDRTRADVENKVDNAAYEVNRRLNEARHDVEHAVAETSEKTIQAFARLALAIAGIMVIGAAAAGIGGSLGAPVAPPVAEVDLDDVGEDDVSFLPQIETVLQFDGDM